MSDERRLLSPVAATLLRAADYIDEHGWCQHTGSREDGSVCIAIAFTLVSTRPTDACIVFGGYVKDGCARWNDAPGRTKDEVLKTLRSAAVHIQKGGET